MGSIDFRVFGGGGGGLLSIFIGSGGVNCGERKSSCWDRRIKTEYLNVYRSLNMHWQGGVIFSKEMYLCQEPWVVNLVRVFLRRHGWGGPWGVCGIDAVVTEKRGITYHGREETNAFHTACICKYAYSCVSVSDLIMATDKIFGIPCARRVFKLH